MTVLNKAGLRKVVKTAVAAVVSVATFGTLAVAGAGTAVADDSLTLPQPASSKTVTHNNDGTYTMTLSVTGKTAQNSTVKTAPTDIVLVVDKSNSMRGDRFTTAKNAATGLADKLLTADNAKSGVVRMSVVTFDTKAQNATNWTTSANDVNAAIGDQPYYADRYRGGTNWDDALEKANAATARTNATKYIVFLSDGLPTYRNDARYGIAGNGQDDEDGRNYAAALAEANKRGNAVLYSVSAASEANDNMRRLANETKPAGTFFDGSNSAKLNDAFNSIYDKITSTAAYSNVVVSDKLSDYVTFAETNADGTPAFTATKGGKAWANAPKPTVDGKTITWNLGSTELEAVEYQLSVKLKPTQDAYDQAVKNGKESTLPSNDDATVNYNVVTKVNGQPGKPQPGTPVKLPAGTITVPVSKVTINKVWAGKEPSTNSLDVTLLKDGKDYQTVTLTKADNWTKTVIVPAGTDSHTWTVAEPNVAEGYTAVISGDNGKKFAAGTADSATITVTNTYEAKPATLNGKDNLKGTKEFTGRADNAWLEGDKFDFALAGADDATKAAVKSGDVKLGNDTASVTGKNGEFSFGDVTFAKAGDYAFAITETKGNIAGVTYDGHAYTVKVKVTDNGKGQLEAKVDSTSGSSTFKNTYAAKAVTSGELTAKKTLKGGDLADQQFTFTAAPETAKESEAKDSDAKTAPAFTSATAKNDAKGVVNFGTVTFDKAGTYAYTVSEKNDAQKNIKYDDSTYTVTYTVTDDTKGSLKIEKTTIVKKTADNTAEAKEIAFANQQGIPATPLTPATPVKPDDGNKPETKPSTPSTTEQKTQAPAKQQAQQAKKAQPKQLSRTGAAVTGVAIAGLIVAVIGGAMLIARRREINSL
ncbi:Spy0128 family protein [Bifidobacterium vansinderenii]|uniref:Prespore-cell-inducing factor n=1 Tax=Bifidobacterium vansinderenii TaxID=1984871 RepID=A0A229VX20_9BIFI|nr:FctA domain-containing protein [Bifidobacterium vansinderenii]OXN00171.1 prespore-cell-inducing factor [Bifidobacterium vansinderenii]